MKLTFNSKAVNKALNAAKEFTTMQNGAIRGFLKKENVSVHVVTPYTNQSFDCFDKFEDGWKIEDGYHVNGAIRSKLSSVESVDFMEDINKAEEIAVLSAEQIKTIKSMNYGFPDSISPYKEWIGIKDGHAYASDGHYLVKANGFPSVDIYVKRSVLSLLPEKMDCVVMKNGNKYILNFDNILYINMYFDDRLPNYDSVIPNDDSNKVAISAKQLIKEIDAVSAAANKVTNQIKFSQGSLIAEDLDLEKHAKVDTCLSFEEDFNINHKLLKSTLKAVGDCEISHIAPNKPLLLKNDMFTAIIMSIIL